jgi:UDP-GlcNAc:undecaprenyl-phosphate GlcNAc-1-phosphate transferase
LVLVFLALVGALILSLSVTPLMIKVAHRLDVVDRPGGHKTHTQPVPYMGGLAMVSAVAVILVVWGAVDDRASIATELVLVAVVGILFASLGLVDDLKNLTPALRLGIEFAGALAISLWAARAETALPSVVDVAISVMWIVGVVNAVNMLDHQDGLAAGTTAISSFTFAWIAWENDQIFVPALCGALCGASLGFLKSNFHPAKIYMGDSGAYFLGLMLAYAGLKMDTPLEQSLSLWIAPLVIGVPVLDSTLVVVSRLRDGRNPLTGGKDHTSHRLIRSGLSKRSSVLVLYSISIAFALAATTATVFAPDQALVVLISSAFVFAILWLFFWKLDDGYD